MDSENGHATEEQNTATELNSQKTAGSEAQVDNNVMDIIGNGQLIKKVGVCMCERFTMYFHW